MKLLKDASDFNEWKDETFDPYQGIQPPAQYPCYGYSVVESWGMEESAPMYLYAENLIEMLSNLKSIQQDS